LNAPDRTTIRGVAVSKSYRYIDPGPLTDGVLELVYPHERWVDPLMASITHPLTQRQMPQFAQVKVEHISDFAARLTNGFDPGDLSGSVAPAYHFWMKVAGSRSALPIVGGIVLRLGDNPNLQRIAGHIGYHVYPFARGHHYAEIACRLLLPLAKTQGLDPLWITCNPDNWASRRTCERLGAQFVEIVPVPPEHPLYPREKQKCRYRLGL
jgi:tagatose 1,6-diphosphate aldolase